MDFLPIHLNLMNNTSALYLRRTTLYVLGSLMFRDTARLFWPVFQDKSEAGIAVKPDPAIGGHELIGQTETQLSPDVITDQSSL